MQTFIEQKEQLKRKIEEAELHLANLYDEINETEDNIEEWRALLAQVGTEPSEEE